MLSLDKLNILDEAYIKEINCDEIVKIRLLDMGFNNGEIVKYVLKSPSKHIKAYLIKNTLVAIRDSDASKIKVGVIDEKNCFNR